MIREKNPKMKTDTVLLILVLLLAVFGLIMLFSISEYNGRVRFGDSAYYFKKQLFATALGLMAMYIQEVAEFWASFLSALRVCQGRRDSVPYLADRKEQKKDSWLLVYVQDYDDPASNRGTGRHQ